MADLASGSITGLSRSLDALIAHLVYSIAFVVMLSFRFM